MKCFVAFKLTTNLLFCVCQNRWIQLLVRFVGATVLAYFILLVVSHESVKGATHEIIDYVAPYWIPESLAPAIAALDSAVQAWRRRRSRGRNNAPAEHEPNPGEADPLLTN